MTIGLLNWIGLSTYGVGLISSAVPARAEIVLMFTGAVTVNDSNNLKIAGTFNADADDCLRLVFDGTNYRQLTSAAN